jgi:UDPglucose 6-dehydrogenase
MKVSIVGTGYVGLVTGACLADRGNDVTCVDLDPTRVALLNRAESPIFEEGLEPLLRKHVGAALRATSDLATAVTESELTLIAVGTPFEGGAIDLTAVLNAAGQIGAALQRKQGYHVVVVKSTVVPGTTDRHVRPMLEAASGKNAGIHFGLGMNPEFLSEGQAIRDFMYPDRIVLGGIDARTIACMERLYASFPYAPRLQTNTRTAEMIKYASNALLANLISFSNEIANICSGMGEIDAVDVMRGVHQSQYFRPRDGGLPSIVSFLRGGCGFGGSCLPKDVKALISHASRMGVPTPMLEATITVNDAQPKKVMELLERHWPTLEGVRVAVLGLAFKPDTSDVRESPAFPIMRGFLERGTAVKAHDPVAIDNARRTFGLDVTYCDTLLAALSDIDAVVVVTPWQEYDRVPELLRARGTTPVLVDARRAFNPTCVHRYEGIGL